MKRSKLSGPRRTAFRPTLTVRQKMLIARMMNRVLHWGRSALGLGMQATCKRNGIWWRLDLDEGIDLSIYLLGAYEPLALRTFRSKVASDDVVFDIGANVGAHTLHFARLVGSSGRVVAIEPTDYAIAKLQANLRINPDLAGRVTLRQHFLVGSDSFPVPPAVAARWPLAQTHSDINAHHLGKPEPLVNATVTTADDVFEAERLSRLNFVKIDVDGHEFEVLQGFRRTLQRFRPKILIELAPFLYEDESASDFDKYVSLVRELDYIFVDTRTGRSLSSDPAVLRRDIPPGCTLNCLMTPRGTL
jgi:FkbM family methyltransferase